MGGEYGIFYRNKKGSALVKGIKIDEKNCSVLNTDAFDKRRFKEIFEMSQEAPKAYT